MLRKWQEKLRQHFRLQASAPSETQKEALQNAVDQMAMEIYVKNPDLPPMYCQERALEWVLERLWVKEVGWPKTWETIGSHFAEKEIESLGVQAAEKGT